MKSPPHLVPFYEQDLTGRIDLASQVWLAAAFLESRDRLLVVQGAGRRKVMAASRDLGCLRELLRPGARLLLVRSTDPRRRTGYTVALVRHARAWVCLVPVLANRILAAAL